MRIRSVNTGKLITGRGYKSFSGKLTSRLYGIKEVFCKCLISENQKLVTSSVWRDWFNIGSSWLSGLRCFFG